MKTVTVAINGKTACGRAGMTILDLAKEMGIRIPSLCHDPRLSPAGACRVCLVEDEKSGALLASCVVPLSPGMVIRTDSPKVVETRRMVVKLMLAAHPESCLLCDKGNYCQLRQIAAELGIGLLDLDRLPNFSGTREINPFIERDLSKCILCGKCIRADHELVVQGAIDYSQRGFKARPATLHDQPLEKSPCTFCGTCTVLCPTGALHEKEKPFQGTVSAKVPSVCPFCACGCTLLLGTNGQHIVEVSPDGRKDSVNYPALCVKGHYGWDYIHSPERLKTPLIRRQGKLTECSWEEALDFLSSELLRIRHQRGANTLAFFGSSQCTNEENYLFQKLARAAMGTNNIDNGGLFQGSPSLFGPDLGWGAMSHPISDLEETKCLLVIGADPEETAPIVAYKIKRAVRFQQAKLILVDPRRTKLAPFAHQWLRPRLGTDGALILGLLRALLDNRRWERARREEEAEILDNFQEETGALDLDWAERESGVDRETMRRAAEVFAGNKPAAILFGNGIWQGVHGISCLQGLVNLSLVTGNLGEGGGGIFPLGKTSNGQGARDMGALPDFLPGYQSRGDPGVRRKFEAVWGKPLPQEAGLTGWQMIAGAYGEKVRGMYILGENPALSFPDGSFVREALGKLEFLVVQDLFLTETAKLARVVLPAASFAEKEGTFTNAERRVQRLLTAAEPAGKSLPDWKILAEVGRRMDLRGYSSPREVLQEINELVPIYGGITYDRLEKESLHWPCFSKMDPGRARLYTRGFAPLKRCRLPERTEALSGKRAEGPFQLILGSTLYHFGCGTRSSKSPRLMGFYGQRRVQMNPEDAVHLGLQEGSRVRLSSGGKEISILLSLEDGLPRGILFLPVAPGEESVYDLLPFPAERGREIPPSRRIAVTIERT